MAEARNLSQKSIEYKIYDLMRNQEKSVKEYYIGKELLRVDTDEIINSLYIRNLTNKKRIKKYLKKGELPKGNELKSFKTALEFEYIYIIELMLRLNTNIYGVQDILENYKIFRRVETEYANIVMKEIEMIGVLNDDERLEVIREIM